MTRPARDSRRIFIRSLTATLIVGPTALLSACGDNHAVDRELQFGSLRAALGEAERLAGTHAETSSTWTLAQTLAHCAQSIEYSMTGFPEMKSELFQHTVGAAAFNVFAWRGRMSHDLAEPIPGAPSLANETDLDSALARLRQSVDDFERSQEPLQPHFAYGSLGKSEYELAHAMHLANHFSAIDA
jgi:hypothetical protein